MNSMSLHNKAYATYLPAVNDGYALTVGKDLPSNRRFPSGLILKDLVFWEQNSLWHYPYLLHSAGLYKVGSAPMNAVTTRDKTQSVLVADSGGYQIGKGTLEGLYAVKRKAMSASNAIAAWQNESLTRRWLLTWLESNGDYAMTIDMPLWATSKKGGNSPFHNCSTQQLIHMTVSNLNFIDAFTAPSTKWLNVIQGGSTTASIVEWWDAVKWFRRGGWALAGSAGTLGGLHHLLMTVLLMRDEGAFTEGQDWLHILGVSTPPWSILLTAIQRNLRRVNPCLVVSFDSSSPFLRGGRFEELLHSPKYSSDKKTWTISSTPAPQGPSYDDPSSTAPFPNQKSPIGKLFQLNHLNVRSGMWEKRNFDSISNAVLINHNVWTYLDAFQRANDVVSSGQTDCIPGQFVECLELIDELFKSNDWLTLLEKKVTFLNSIAPMEI